MAPLPPAPGDPNRAAFFALAGVVALHAPKATGSLSLSWSDEVFSLFSPPIAPTALAARDLLRELTNQLSGRVKNRLLNFALNLTVGVPSVLSGQALERQRAQREDEIIYPFRTLRGRLVVALDLSIDPEGVNYSGSHRVAKEGDFIAF